MSALVAVARREIQERRFLLAAAVVAAALPYAAYLAVRPLAGARAAVDAQTLLGLLLALTFPASVAVIVGISLVGREMAERRLGFYFSRPISAAALAAGKFLGGAALVGFAFLCCFLPLDVLNERGSFVQRNTYVAFTVFVLMSFLMLVAHVGSTMYRARSPWLAADIALAAGTVAVIGAVTRTIVEAGAFLSLRPRVPVFLAAGVVALMAAAAAQLTVGRTDARRAHLVLSVAVWISLALILGGYAGWGRWLLGATPGQAGGAGYPLVVSPSGDGLFFRGLTGRGEYLPFYLMDAGSGAFLRLSPDPEPMPTFSADGRAAAWISIPEPWEEDRRPRLTFVRLEGGVRIAARTPMEEAMRWHSVLAVHPDHRQAVIAGDATAGIVDLETARVGASVPRARVMAADILADGRIRLFSTAPERSGGTALSVAVWSPREHALVETLRIPQAALLTRRDDVAVVATGQREKAILDLATGAERRVAVEATADTMPRALVLGDGRLALSMGTEVRITDAAGTTLAVVPLPPKSQASALREPEPGRLAVGVWSLILSKKGTLLVDAATGKVLREEPGLLPAGAQSGPGAQAEPGSLASRLFTDEDGGLLALEPGGRRRVILAAAAGEQ